MDILGSTIKSQNFNKKNDEGQALVVTALALVVLMLMAGLGLDVAYLRYQKQQMQKAADAGAIAGASALAYQGAWHSAAVNDVNANGFTATQSNGLLITPSNPPADPPFNSGSNSNNYVEVVVSQPVPTFFMGVRRALGVTDTSVTVSARAVAGVRNGSGCIYILDPSTTDNNTLVVDGSASIQSDCGIYSDSPNSKGFTISGSGCITSTKGGVNIVASAYQGNSGTGCPSPGVDPAPTENIKPFKDPLAFVKAPSYDLATCTTQGHNQTVFNQGCYIGGITVSTTATFNSGVYILVGGGLTIQGGATATGSGVTFFNTGTAPTYNDYRGFTISGSSNVTLSAPTSPPVGNPTLEGMLFFEDSNVPWSGAGSSQKSEISGGSATQLSGAIYLPTSHLTYSGGSTLVAYIDIVAYQLEVSGPSIIQDSLGGNGVLPINTVVAVE